MKLPTMLTALTVLFIGFISFKSLADVSKGEVAPDFVLPSVKDDKAVKLSDFRGKVVYLDFWASWCKPCIQSFPALNKIYNKYKAEGFEILAVNLDQKKLNAASFLDEHQVDYVNVYDPKMTTGKLYNVNIMPVGYLIDRQGKVRVIHKGFIPGDELGLEKAVKFLLRENKKAG